MIIDESPSFTESELKAAFDYYSEIFNSDDVEKKMAAAATMLFQLEKFLRDRIDGLDTSAIISLLEEFAQIEKGNEPKFIKSYKLGLGQPDVVEHQQLILWLQSIFYRSMDIPSPKPQSL